MVQLLLDKGADVNIKAAGNWYPSAIERVGIYGRSNTSIKTSKLLAAGVDHVSKDRALRLALSRAPNREPLEDWKEQIKLLIESGANVQEGLIIRDIEEHDCLMLHPLLLLSNNGPDDGELVKAVYKAGADIQKIGTNPLENAVRRSMKEMVAALLEAGARPSRKLIIASEENLCKRDGEDYYTSINRSRGYFFKWDGEYCSDFKNEEVELVVVEKLFKTRQDMLCMLQQALQIIGENE